MKRKILRLKPSFHYKVSAPSIVKIIMVAGKWVHLLIETEKDAEIKWGSTRRVSSKPEKEAEEIEDPENKKYRENGI